MTGPRDIPDIMRSKGWPIGAALMEHWFSLPATTAPPFTLRNDDIVTMKWVLGFPHAKKVYDKLMKDRIWANTAAQKEVKKLMADFGMTRYGGCFGVFQSTQPVIHKYHVNTRPVEQGDDLDDLAAALARFNFHVQIGGDVDPADSSGKIRVTIDTVGVYIRDQYDFTGDQFLGYWDKASNEVSQWKPWVGDKITNETFRDWRSANGKGGDYEVFSDVLVTTLATPDVLVL